MPFDDYTLDPYSGGITFRDSSTGEELLTTPEAGMARMQEIDAQRAALMPGYVPETTGVAYSTELPPYVANVAPALPPKPSLFDEGSMALAEATPPAVVDLGEIVIDGRPNQPGSRADVSASSVARQLDRVSAPTNAALVERPAGTPVAQSAGPGFFDKLKAGMVSMLPSDSPLRRTAETGAPIVPPPPPPGQVEKAIAGAVAAALPADSPIGRAAAAKAASVPAPATPTTAPPAAPTTAPAAAPAPGAAAAPNRIVSTPNTGAQEAAKPAEPPPMVDVGRTDTTTSTGGVERSSTNRRETERAVGMSPAAATRIFNAMRNQGVINANQADALATGKMQLAELNDEQARIYNAAVNDAAIRQRIVEDQTIERYTRAEEYQRQASEMRVDPARMWKNASTGEKIQLGIAALLGAFGSALQGKQDNAGVKIIEDAIKRDVDLQMQDIAAKREFANDTTRMAKLLMDQGNNSKEAADYIKNLQILSATERAKGISQRAGNWRVEDLDPVTGMPRPGTRSYEANRALIDAELKARQFVGNWEAERAGRERVTAEDAVKRATQTQRSVQTQQAAAAPAPSTYAGLPIIRVMNEDGKMETLGVRNIKGVDVQKLTQNADELNVARQEIPGIQERLNNLTDRAAPADVQAAYSLVRALTSKATGQGAMTADEKKTADAEITSIVNAQKVVRTVEKFLIRKQRQIKEQTRAYVLTQEQEEEALRGQKAEADAKARSK